MREDAERPDGAIRQGVAVVVVNYRTPELTVEAVRSVLTDPAVDEVVVVDNASGDGSVDFLRAAFAASSVRIVESSTNVGFGRGVNLGVSVCRSPHLFLLNSDAIVRPGTLAALSRVLVEDPGVGVVAPVVYRPDGRTVQPDAYGPLPRVNAVLRTVRRRRGRTSGPDDPPGWVSGAAMMLRRAEFTAMGGFDPDFTMYLEDVDLCRRVHAMGKRVVRQPAGSVVHLGGRSSAARATQVDQFHRSKAVYLRKAGAGPLPLLGAAVLRLARVGVQRLRDRVAPRP